jgi:5-formyltetrahydrofolate cyclo-ligase
LEKEENFKSMKQIIQEQINKISAECSSIYSKEDVIKILNTISINQETQTNSTSMEPILKKLYTVFEDKINSEDWSEVVEPYSAEFRIDNSNEIVLDHIDIRTGYLCNLVQYSINEAIKSAI